MTTMTPPIGWDAEGNARPTGISAIDDLVSRVQDATNRGWTAALHHRELYRSLDHTAVDDNHLCPADQVKSGLVVYTDCSAIRLGGKHRLTWACVALPGAAPLTIGDVALIIGTKSTTLNTWIDTGLPSGNQFPKPDWTAGLSSIRPIRLWSKRTIYIWHHKRPGRGYRSDRSIKA